MRSTPTLSRKFLFLAPSHFSVPQSFAEIHTDAGRHGELLAKMQRLRGRVYLQDGAIRESQLSDGRHRLDLDGASWHLLVFGDDEEIHACLRYREYSNRISFSDLSVARSALAHHAVWGPALERAVESELAMSRNMGLPYAEFGGWALDEQVRCTTAAVTMVLATFALAQKLGGAVGVSTVTQRNCSASMLRRLGGRSLEHNNKEIPNYFDPHFNCNMEVLRFHSWAPNPRYTTWIDELISEFRSVPVVCANSPRHTWDRTVHAHEPHVRSQTAS